MKTTIQEVSKKLRKIDLCMMSTLTGRGQIASRPMSNNQDVDYDGTSYFFTRKDSKLIRDVKKNANVTLQFSGKDNFFASVEGKAKLYTGVEKLKEHWQKKLDTWFEQGPETPDVVMIEVKAKRVKVWQDYDEAEIKLTN